MAKFRDFQPGTRVRLSGKFLRSTGQMAGGEGRKVWTVLAVTKLPGGAPLLTLDEPREDMSSWTAEEIAADPSLKWRRISSFNCTIVGQLDSRDTP